MTDHIDLAAEAPPDADPAARASTRVSTCDFLQIITAVHGEAAVVVHAFQIGFMATAGVALLGAACALRSPRIHL